MNILNTHSRSHFQKRKQISNPIKSTYVYQDLCHYTSHSKIIFNIYREGRLYLAPFTDYAYRSYRHIKYYIPTTNVSNTLKFNELITVNII